MAMPPSFAPTGAAVGGACDTLASNGDDDEGGEGQFLGMSDYVLGITCGLIGSIAINTGNNLQSLGMKNLHEAYAAVHAESGHGVVVGDGDADEATEAVIGVSAGVVSGELVIEDLDGASFYSSSGTATMSPRTMPSRGSTDIEDVYESGLARERRAGSVAVGEPSSPLVSDKITHLASSRTEPPSGCDDHELDMTQSRTWMLGSCIFLIGSVFNFGSYGLAAQSVLAPLEASQFITNIFFSKFLLHAKILPRMIWGTVLICGGTVLIVAFGNDKNDILSFEDLRGKYLNPIFLSYLCFVVIAATSLHSVHSHYQRMQDVGSPLPHSELVLPITYAVFSAYFGTLFVVQAKVFMKMLQYAANANENLIMQPLLYITIATALPLVVVWLHRLNEALSLYDPLFIIPLIQSNFIIWAIISGGIYFEEFACFDATMWAGFLGGLIIVLCGLYQLRPEPHDSKIAPEQPATSLPSAARTVSISVPPTASYAPSSSSAGEAGLCLVAAAMGEANQSSRENFKIMRMHSAHRSLHMKRSVGSLNIAKQLTASRSRTTPSLQSLSSSNAGGSSAIARAKTLGASSFQQLSPDQHGRDDGIVNEEKCGGAGPRSPSGGTEGRRWSTG